MRRFGAFWWDFLVGDDWRIAAGVLLGMGITAVLAAWWVLPLAVAAVLWVSLRSVARRRTPTSNSH